MLLKTVEKKLRAPAMLILACLALMAAADCLRADEECFVQLRHDAVQTLSLDGGFAALSFSGIEIYDPEGTLIFEELRRLDPEKSASSGNLLAVCAGESVLLYDGGGLVGEIPASGRILALDVCSRRVAVSRQGSDYPCTVTFYEEAEPLFMRCLASGTCTELKLAERRACLLVKDALVFMSGTEEIARAEATAGMHLYPTKDGVCASGKDALYFFDWTGKCTGSYTEPFGAVQSFNGSICVQTAAGAALLEPDGSVRAAFEDGRILSFGAGLRPVLIMGENVLILDDNMQTLYTIENKYIPLNVITERAAATVFWPRAAEMHRK